MKKVKGKVKKVKGKVKKMKGKVKKVKSKMNRSFDEAYDDLRYVCEMFVKGHQFGAVLHG